MWPNGDRWHGSEAMSSPSWCAGTAVLTIDDLTERMLQKSAETDHGSRSSTFGSISIGVAVARQEHSTASDVFRDADVRSTTPKVGVVTVRGASLLSTGGVDDRAELERDLRHAVERSQLQLQYEPITDLRNGRVIGMEALVLWDRPGFGLVTHDVFVPVAEETGMIALIDRFALFEASATLRRWQEYGAMHLR